MFYIYTMEYYSAIKDNDFTKFTGKCMNLDNILSEVTQSQKNTHGMYSLISKKHGIPMVQLMDHMKLKRKEDQRVDVPALRRGNKIVKGSREWEGLGRKRRGEGKKAESGMEGDR